MAKINKLESVEGEGSKKTASVLMLISARRDGYRRAGRAWSAAGDVVDAADFTDDQMAALEADVNISIGLID